MGKLTKKLASYPVIGLDTSIFIYHFEAHPVYLPLVSEILAGVERGQWEAITSVITLMEINVRPLQLGFRIVAQKYETLLVNFPNLRIVDIDRDIARRAAQLRAEYRIRPADAFQAAACISHGGKVFITNDRQLAKLRGELNVLILDDHI